MPSKNNHTDVRTGTESKPKRQRDSKGRFVKGNTAAKSSVARTTFRNKCQEYGLKGIEILYKMLLNDNTTDSNKIDIVKIFLDYGCGRAITEAESERLSIEREKLRLEKEKAERETAEGGKALRIIMSDEVKELAE